MAFNREVQMFIKEFSKELDAQNAAIFAGAGLSVPAGYVSWKGLLGNIIDELGLNAEIENDLVSIAQYHCNENAGNRSRLNQVLINEFSSNANITENHKILARLPIFTYWTTNYDRLIERSLEDAGKVADVKYTVPQLAITRPRRDAVIYKMHGDIDHPDEAVITKDDYETYHIKKSAFIENLSGELVSKTFLFIGFSFKDPNLDYILARIRSRYTQHQRRHYCFIRKVSRSDYVGDSEFEYEERKQNLFIGDLKRFNIKSILISEYSEITDILREISQIYRARTIFISGSAHEYGAWPKDDAEAFIRKLSAEIIKRDLKVVSGFGLGVGSAVIAGSLEEAYLRKGASAGDRLILKPFPQPQSGIDHVALWNQYRQEMLSISGISIFAFGNKLKSGAVLKADGVEKEYKVARDNNVYPVPIGATGYAAADIWEDVGKNFENIFGNIADDLKIDFATIGDSSQSLDKIMAATLRIVDRLTRG